MSAIIGTLQSVISAAADGPIYLQLASVIEGMAADGRLQPGEQLPTSRQLSAELGLHRNTISRVYEELAARGVVESTVGRGTFIAARTPVSLDSGRLQQSGIPWNALISTVATAEPLSRFERLNSLIGGGDYINLSRMHPSDELIPSDLIRRSTDAVIKAHGPQVFGYGPSQGLQELRELIAMELRRASIPASHEQILITTGSQQALDLTARLLCDPGDTVLMEEHSYTGAINAFTSIGARIRAIPCDEHGPLPQALHNIKTGTVKAIYLMPSCSNPTGRIISEERRRAIRDWSNESGVPIIEDDYGADLDDKGVPAALRSRDSSVLYLGTFSKKLAPALRVGFIIAPEQLLPRINSLKQAMDLGTSLLQQYVLADFIKRGYLRRHLRKIQAAYHARREVLARTLKQHLPPEVHVRTPPAGVLMWLQLPNSLNSEDVFRKALDKGVMVSPGSFHSVSPLAANGVRLTFCAEPEERLREGGRRLSAAIRELQEEHIVHHKVNNAPSLDGV